MASPASGAPCSQLREPWLSSGNICRAVLQCGGAQEEECGGASGRGTVNWPSTEAYNAESIFCVSFPGSLDIFPSLTASRDVEAIRLKLPR